jgi:hypothetical protein
MDKPLGCLYGVIIRLDTSNHLSDGGSRMFLKNSASLQSFQISLDQMLQGNESTYLHQPFRCTSRRPFGSSIGNTEFIQDSGK